LLVQLCNEQVVIALDYRERAPLYGAYQERLVRLLARGLLPALVQAMLAGTRGGTRPPGADDPCRVAVVSAARLLVDGITDATPCCVAFLDGASRLDGLLPPLPGHEDDGGAAASGSGSSSARSRTQEAIRRRVASRQREPLPWDGFPADDHMVAVEAAGWAVGVRWAAGALSARCDCIIRIAPQGRFFAVNPPGMFLDRGCRCTSCRLRTTPSCSRERLVWFPLHSTRVEGNMGNPPGSAVHDAYSCTGLRRSAIIHVHVRRRRLCTPVSMPAAVRRQAGRASDRAAVADMQDS
jgi:hypothetical protein